MVVDASSGTALWCVVELYPDEVEPRSIQNVGEVDVWQDALWRSGDVVALRFVCWVPCVLESVDHLRVSRCESADRSIGKTALDVEVEAIDYCVAPRTWSSPAGVDRSPSSPQEVCEVSPRRVGADIVVCWIRATER